ncbi:uncharacterized protein Z518_02624 [Rhinocladiella mackenziei CBS 650.93]|uniref:Rhinocladiella mackenziei CBS 650.93 unplaced genomic scaffold supercont1.2, whole genome shotgun sequence n=1 Tax=Rhinocladiella mackenziei CBS 650.93 TaxID=1442369 RepID=A0A0D2JFF3_9EURO|nr:uncharacterized protein Z518_02624 [Rhinocladiella mackenziei CBS 650.93]KIX07970.1 hypothetical protein Z518_02624 [Rhinocladiella mackenziei CBS 650.93]
MTLPQKVVAGVTVPDLPLVAKAIDFAREYSTDNTFNHIPRSFLWGFIVADTVIPERDREVHVVAILYDLRFSVGHLKGRKI